MSPGLSETCAVDMWSASDSTWSLTKSPVPSRTLVSDQVARPDHRDALRGDTTPFPCCRFHPIPCSTYLVICSNLYTTQPSPSVFSVIFSSVSHPCFSPRDLLKSMASSLVMGKAPCNPQVPGIISYFCSRSFFSRSASLVIPVTHFTQHSPSSLGVILELLSWSSRTNFRSVSSPLENRPSSGPT